MRSRAVIVQQSSILVCPLNFALLNPPCRVAQASLGQCIAVADASSSIRLSEFSFSFCLQTFTSHTCASCATLIYAPRLSTPSPLSPPLPRGIFHSSGLRMGEREENKISPYKLLRTVLLALQRIARLRSDCEACCENRAPSCSPIARAMETRCAMLHDRAITWPRSNAFMTIEPR